MGGGGGQGIFGINITELTCQGCKVSLFTMKNVLQNKFIIDIAMTFFSESVCPLIAFNTSVCAGGTRNLGGPLLDAFSQAFLDPEYFCSNTIVMCNDGDF